MPTLNVIVNRVAFPKITADPDSWYILITDRGPCKGSMAWRPQENECLILEGEWSEYKGEREFAFKQARIDVPVDAREQLHYVCERTPGLGPAMEQLIWERAGLAWQEIGDKEVSRLHGKLYAEFKIQLESLREKSEEAKVVAALIGKGATMNMACAAWKKWEKETLGVVNNDCYRLAELSGYGFKDVDLRIRQTYLIADNDKRRIRAAVVYSLRRLTDHGDTIAEWEALFAQAIGLLGGYANMISDCTSELFEEGSLKAFAKSTSISLAGDWKAETAIWDFINKPGEQAE